MDTEKVAARIVKGLVTMRGAAARLHTASVDRQHQDVRAALTTLDNEYFMLREYLNQLVEQTEERAD
jgi:hypothetical protein